MSLSRIACRCSPGAQCAIGCSEHACSKPTIVAVPSLGFQFINGGGRAEVEAAHIKSVEAKGPDVVQNGVALSGTVHWMFDRGLLTVADNSEILLSNHINDVDGVRKILRGDCRAQFPENDRDRPDSAFLRWHRENCFKGAALN